MKNKFKILLFLIAVSVSLSAQTYYDSETYAYLNEPIIDENTYWDSLYAPARRDSCNFYAPNSFTPNGDGLNDVWVVSIKSCFITKYECKIYDRYGVIVWESYDPYEFWIGNVNGGSHYAMTDLYKYVIHLSGSGWSNTYRGHITLLR